MSDEHAELIRNDCHPWCRCTARDEAVRAAEDGRRGPLPTLAEAILAARAMMPKSVSGSSGPEPENTVNGMRTERITLEITHDLDAPLGDWIVQVIDESLGYGESVRVVEESAPAANGAAGTEPDAWGVRRKGGVDAVVHRLFRSSAECSAEQYGGTVVPLYASPPPARGWLTEEERDLIAGITDDDDYTEEGQNIAKAILARSTPPEVVLPGDSDRFRYGDDAIANRDRQWLAALAAAGVKWKEVGRG